VSQKGYIINKRKLSRLHFISGDYSVSNYYPKEMSAPDSSSSSSAAVDPDPALPSPSLTTITDLDSELSSLSTTQPDLSRLAGQVEEGEGDEAQKQQSGIVHDLAPVHNILVQLATSLQVKVDQATRELHEIRTKLAAEMRKTADSLSSLGEVKLPSGFPASMSTSSMLVPDSPASETILAIHHYRDQAVTALNMQAEVLSSKPKDTNPGMKADNIDTASDGLKSSFQQLGLLLDQVDQAVKELQNYDGETSDRDIDLLEEDTVSKKMGELSVRDCSLQSCKPVRSQDHELDLLKIMLLAQNAKCFVHEVDNHMRKIKNMVLEEMISPITTYTKLTKENLELQERRSLYWRLEFIKLTHRL